MHWGRILRNVLSNWTSYIVTAVVGFALVPVVVHALGNTGYGLWTLVLSTTGYFGLLDLGIRSSVGRFVTRHLALHDEAGVNRTASTAFVMLACGGMVAFLATLAIIPFFSALKLEPEYASAARTALLIAGFNIACILPLGVFSSMLIAMERYDVVSGITIATELSRAALVVWCLGHGFGLIGLATIALAMTVVQYSAMAVFVRLLYSHLHISLGYANLATAKELFGFSVYRFIWIIANQLIFYSDSLVIAFFAGAAAVTPYAIAGSLINYGRNVVGLLADTLYPAASRLDAQGDLAGLRRLLIVGTRLVLLVALPLCLGLVFLGRQFITLWMGAAHADSAIVLTVLALPLFVSLPQLVSALVLAGMAKHRALAYFALAEGVANLVLSVVLVQKMGIIGVAWGTAIPAVISSTIVIPLFTLRVLRLNAWDYLGVYIRPAVCAIPIIGLGYALSHVEASSWLMFAGEAAFMCSAFGIEAYFVCLAPNERAVLVQRVSAVFQREAAVNEI